MSALSTASILVTEPLDLAVQLLLEATEDVLRVDLDPTHIERLVDSHIGWSLALLSRRRVQNCLTDKISTSTNKILNNRAGRLLVESSVGLHLF